MIRLVELQEDESQLLKGEVDYCIDEVNLLSFLMKDELADTGVMVTGLVAYCGQNTHSQTACKSCGDIIVPFKIFNSVETFKAFWETFVIEKKFDDLAIGLTISEKKDKNSVFQAVASKVIGYLAHLQFTVLKKPILPLKKNNPTGDIKQAELLLDCYQMEIAYSNDKRVWLEGNYGTGKTVVALKKLELLCKGLKDNEVIYYINFARQSSLDFVIKQMFEKNGNVKTIKGEISLSNTINLHILQKERELGTKNIHLVVDEYATQDLSIEEANSLGKILREEEQFINSTVLIAVQPIEINRVDEFYESGVKRQFSQKKQEFDKLIQIVGMKKKFLRNVMRTTVEINTLVEITQSYLDNQSNQHVRLQSELKSRSHSNLFKLPQTSSSKISSSVSTVSSDSSKNASAGTPIQSQEASHHDLNKAKSKNMNFSSPFRSTNSKQSSLLFQDTSPKSSSSASATPDDSSNPATSSPAFQSERVTADYYQLHKVIPSVKNIANRGGTFQQTVTQYRYTCESQVGHGIVGQLPRLINLTYACNDFELIALIASVLEKIILAERTVVIHFEDDDPPRWLKSLFQLKNSLTMTTNTEEFLTEKTKMVLVKNLSFLRGLEFSDVLLILDSNEHHMRQFIPEAIARCTSNLSILIKPIFTYETGIFKDLVGESNETNTVKGLVGEWKANNQDDAVISILEIGFCSKFFCKKRRHHRKIYCKDNRYPSYRVHENNEQYRTFLTETERTYNQGLQPNYRKKLEEAQAL